MFLADPPPIVGVVQLRRDHGQCLVVRDRQRRFTTKLTAKEPDRLRVGIDRIPRVGKKPGHEDALES